MIHPIWLVCLTLPIVIALTIAWKQFGYNKYIGILLGRDLLFFSLYFYIVLFGTLTEPERDVARTLFILMQALMLWGSLLFVYELWKRWKRKP